MTQKRIEVGVFADGVIESTAQGKMMGVVSDPAMLIVNENVANELIGSIVYYIGETTVEEPICNMRQVDGWKRKQRMLLNFKRT